MQIWILLHPMSAQKAKMLIMSLVFYANLNFLAVRVRARSENADFCLSTVASSRRAVSLGNSILKIKTQIRPIFGFFQTFSKFGRVWAWIVHFLLKLISKMNSKMWIFKIFNFLSFHHHVHCSERLPRKRRVESAVRSKIHFLALKRHQNIKFDRIKNIKVYLTIICLVFYSNLKFLAARVRARSEKCWILPIFGR